MSPISSRNRVPPWASSKLALPPRHGAGERAFLVAEQLRLEQRLGERRARHGDEGRGLARALGMDGAREQFLAGAALAEDQDRGLAARGAPGQIEHPVHRRVLADHVAEVEFALQHLAQEHVLADQRLLRDDLHHHQAEFFGVERLDEVVVGAGLHGLDRGLDRGVGGHDDDGHVLLGLLRRFEHLEAVHARHLQVDQENRPPAIAQHLQRGRAVVGGVERVAVLRQPSRQRFPDDFLVVNHEDARAFLAHGVRPSREAPDTWLRMVRRASWSSRRPR